jgi:hypothetical protein
MSQSALATDRTIAPNDERDVEVEDKCAGLTFSFNHRWLLVTLNRKRHNNAASLAAPVTSVSAAVAAKRRRRLYGYFSGGTLRVLCCDHQALSESQSSSVIGSCD